MGALGLFLFGQREIKIQRQREREGGYKAVERRHIRARGKCAVVLGALALVLSLTSVSSPPAVYATFPGANGKILFESTRDGGDFDIFTMNPDGAGVTQLTNNSGIEDRFASWSADGARIVYASTQDGGDFDIWVMNADGSGKTQLTFNSASDELPVWSPDSAKIAFGGTEDGDYEVYVMNADGSGQTQLTFNSIFDFGPAWSPDGATIAFQSGADQGGGLEIWKMNADGSGATQLTSNSFQDTSVSWAPDGLKLLFRRDLGFGAGWGEVFSMNADGTGQTNITNTATIFDSEGRFSPDGTKIVFSSNEDDPAFEVWVMNADGTGRIRLTNSAGNDFGDDWQPLLSNCVTPPADLVAWWPGDGDANDIQGSNHGTLQNGATFATGLVGSALSFDGVDDYINVGAHPNLHPSAITVDFWLKATDLNNPNSNGAPSIISSNLSDFDGYQLQLDPDGRVLVVIGGNTARAVYISTVPEIAVAQWHHVAVTYDGVGGTGSLKLYVNGVQKGFTVIACCGISEPSGPIFYSGDYPLNMGRRAHDGANNFQGLVDEVEIFNRALSAGEIAGIFNAGGSGKCKNQLTALGPANVWIGLKNSDDVGTKFDLLAEVYKNGSPVGSGQLNAVPGGSSGFKNAVLRTISLALSSPTSISPGDTLSIKLSVRIAVGVSGHRSGTARLWFNDAAANSRFDATIGGASSDHFLLNGFTLGAAAGLGPKKTIDVFVDRAVGGNPFKPFGTWSLTF